MLVFSLEDNSLNFESPDPNFLQDEQFEFVNGNLNKIAIVQSRTFKVLDLTAFDCGIRRG